MHIRFLSFLLAGLLLSAFSAQAQLIIDVRDSSSRQPLPGATLQVNDKAVALSDSTGRIRHPLADGLYRIRITHAGYEEKTFQVSVSGSTTLLAWMLPVQQALEEVTVIASTRNNQRIENAPLKVEVLGRTEMEEENTIKPANIASILGDISGIQIQQSSAVSGNASVRIQGLDGKYTQILRDGMPLYDGFSGGFGILSIPPLDLKQVELIKGSASTLYGGGAIGGLVNIISRKPTRKHEAVLTLNRSTLNETNLNTYAAKRYNKFGYTLFAGYTHQKEKDINKDGLSDLPLNSILVLHPRVFFYPGEKTTVSAGYTFTADNRKGGDMLVLDGKTDGIHQYFENNKTRRHTLEFTAEHYTAAGNKIEWKSSFSSFHRTIEVPGSFYGARQQNGFAEWSYLIPKKQYSLVAGANAYLDGFRKDPLIAANLDRYSNTTIGAFAQYTRNLGEQTVLEGGLRNDYQRRYGNFLLPRLSLFHRFNERWGFRAGAGAGYKLPNPFAPQLQDIPVWTIGPIPESVKAERSMGYNAEVNYKYTWGEDNSFFINHAYFLTRIRHAVLGATLGNGTVTFENATAPVTTKGWDTYIQMNLSGWELYAGYTYTIANRNYAPAGLRFMPYTPKVRMAFTLVKEWEHWRAGLEGSWNGKQYRLDGTQTPGYFFIAAMIEKHFGKHSSLVLNGENLLDFRQTRKEAIFTGSITNPQFLPLWAPIDGRVINLSYRYKM